MSKLIATAKRFGASWEFRATGTESFIGRKTDGHGNSTKEFPSRSKLEAYLKWSKANGWRVTTMAIVRRPKATATEPMAPVHQAPRLKAIPLRSHPTQGVHGFTDA